MNEQQEKKRGRPSLYKPKYVKQARKLCLAGIDDPGLAFFFDTDFIGLANWADNIKKGASYAST